MTILIRLVMEPEDLEDLRTYLLERGLSGVEVLPLAQTMPTVLGQPWIEALIISFTSSPAMLAFAKVGQTWLQEKGKSERFKMWLVHQDHEEELDSMAEVEARAAEANEARDPVSGKKKPTAAGTTKRSRTKHS